MHTEKHDPEDPLNEMGYDTRDVNVKGVSKAAIWFFVFTAGSFVIGSFALRLLFIPHDPGTQAKASSTALVPAGTPLLQTNTSTKVDIMSFRQAETKVLTTSKELPDGSVRIPVERAMNLLTRRGFAPTGNPTAAVTVGNTIKQNALSPDEAKAQAAGTPR